MSDPLSNSHTAPKFAAPDPAALAAWYESALGFPRIAVFEQGAYAIVGRGDLVLHLWKCADRNIAENTSCYTEISNLSDLNALHAEWLAQSRNAEFSPGRIDAHPQDQTGHGMREFHVWDPAGNLIGFGATLET